jgi:hypothetical protein
MKIGCAKRPERHVRANRPFTVDARSGDAMRGRKSDEMDPSKVE